MYFRFRRLTLSIALILFYSDKYFPALGFGARIPPANQVRGNEALLGLWDDTNPASDSYKRRSRPYERVFEEAVFLSWKSNIFDHTRAFYFLIRFHIFSTLKHLLTLMKTRVYDTSFDTVLTYPHLETERFPKRCVFRRLHF